MSPDRGTSQRQRILIADNDPTTSAHVQPALEQDGYTVIPATDGTSALRALFAHHPHLIILSLSLPGMDAWTVLERIREVTNTPVLVVSGNSAVGARLRAFELRAQDYITKPFNLHELELRIKAALQRHAAARGQAEPAYDDGRLYIDGWKREVAINGRRLHVTARELNVLVALVRQPGRLVPYNDLVDPLPGGDGQGEAALRSLIHRLRHKLNEAAPGSRYIVTQRSLGIRLNVM